MSDQWSAYCQQKFNDTFNYFTSVEQSPHLREDFIDRGKISLTLELKNPFLRKVHQARKSFPEYSYIFILNSQLNAFKIKEDAERVEQRLQQVCYRICLQYKTTHRTGQKRVDFDKKKSLSIAIYESELKNITDLSYQLTHFQNDNMEMSIKCRTLYNELIEEKKKQLS